MSIAGNRRQRTPKTGKTTYFAFDRLQKLNRAILLGGLLILPNSSKAIKNPKTGSEKSNLLIIMTDEHNFRTLGCYRELLSHDQAFVWGDGNNVETPHIDFLAKNGVLFTKFYASTPLCSPSRGSFVSGMYPQHNGVPKNDVPIHDDVITFAEVLRQDGYRTGYAGKWHLDGESIPQWAPERQFGFTDNRYMFNRGHWKKLEDTPEGPVVNARLDSADEKSFTTDFLTDKAINFIKTNKTKQFCYMLSFPDPHGPDKVRPPYDTMYEGMSFEAPRTYNKPVEGVPAWAKPKEGEGIDQSQYFGMVKCIDDNIGRLTECLRQNGLLQNTIIVFTADHGDLRAEHHRYNKSVPLEASAKVPFIVYYLAKIRAGSVVNNAFNNVDFAPTILKLLNQKIPRKMQGTDFSELILKPEKQHKWKDITFVRSAGMGSDGTWIAAFTSRYKLIISKNDDPWLIDMETDPDELINFINEPGKAEIVKELANGLNEYRQKYSDPFLQGTKMGENLNSLLVTYK